MIKTISISECFIVFSTVIACCGIVSPLAAARMVNSGRRSAHATATWARIQQSTSKAEAARLMFRRQSTERRQSSLPPQGSGWRSESRQNSAIPTDSTQAGSCRAAVQRSCEIQEPPRWIRKSVDNSPLTQAGRTASPPRAELVDSSGFFAGLVLRHLRAGNRSAIDSGQPGRSSARNAKGDPGSVGAGAVRSPPAVPPGRPVAVVQAGAQEPVPRQPPLETLLAELGYRRLHSLAARERPE
jgi:hypothetical protein